MKALVAAFNQEKALVGAFSMIVKTDCETDGSLHSTTYMCALYHSDPDGGGEESVGTLPRVSGVKALLHAAAERQRAPGNVSPVTRVTLKRVTTDVSRAADTQAAAAGAARGEGGGAGGQEQGVLQEAEVLRVLHRLRHHRLLLQYVVPAPAAPNPQLTTTIQSSPCTWSYPTVSTTSGHRSITLSTSPPARTRKLERKYH